jgi:hypothetical protein
MLHCVNMEIFTDFTVTPISGELRKFFRVCGWLLRLDFCKLDVKGRSVFNGCCYEVVNRLPDGGWIGNVIYI